ncbi:hypothetical protein HDU97_007365 [Phlyctochytrium planicorne]|nr:hypothetical protein HDU97_007365 [Phlyctochytrium planicorne]
MQQLALMGVSGSNGSRNMSSAASSSYSSVAPGMNATAAAWLQYQAALGMVGGKGSSSSGSVMQLNRGSTVSSGGRFGAGSAGYATPTPVVGSAAASVRSFQVGGGNQQQQQAALLAAVAAAANEQQQHQMENVVVPVTTSSAAKGIAISSSTSASGSILPPNLLQPILSLPVTLPLATPSLPAVPQANSPTTPSPVLAPTPNDDEAVVHEPVETPYVCVSGYEPTGTCEEGEEELRIRPGEHVIVSDIFEDGWAVGTNLNTSTVGLFQVSKVTFDRTLTTDPSNRVMSSHSALHVDDEEDGSLSSNGVGGAPGPGSDGVVEVVTHASAAFVPSVVAPLAPVQAPVVAPPEPAAIPEQPQPQQNIDQQKVLLLEAQIQQMKMMMERMEASLKMAQQGGGGAPQQG